MGLIETASRNSVWRGLDYYETKKVLTYSKTGDYTYDGVVSGSGGKQYSVHIDKLHPRKSTCNCPFADGRRVVCKHMLALYFTAEPEVANDYLKQVEEWEEMEDEMYQQYMDEIQQYVYSLSKSQLQEQLFIALMNQEDDRFSDW